MKTYTSIAVAGLCAIALAGCAGQEVGYTDATASNANTFTTGLHTGYYGIAKSEYAQGDYKDSDYFAILAQRAGRGEVFDPQLVSARLDNSAWPDLSPEMVATLTAARSRLMTVLPQGRTAAPAAAARAQVGFDCWLGQQEENFQPKDIAACRNSYDTAMAELDTALRPAAAPAPRAAAPTMTTAPRTFLVFFDWDSNVLTDGARSVIASAASASRQSGQVTMIATGHADSSGADTYNLGLSGHRADAVKAELVRLGIPVRDINVAARGETDPLVQTGNDVREPQNRRVQIVLN